MFTPRSNSEYNLDVAEEYRVKSPVDHRFVIELKTIVISVTNRRS